VIAGNFSSSVTVHQLRDVIRPEPGIALAMAAWIPAAPKAIAYVCPWHT